METGTLGHSVETTTAAATVNEATGPKKPNQSVIVIGGGLAGLTAAKYLVDADYKLTLLEKRPILGGKVSAWKDADGDWIESGLHVFFGAYEEIYTLMKELGIYQNVLWKKHTLLYTLKDGERFSFETINLPSPFHLLPAAFKNKYFTLKERLTLVKALGPMLFGTAKYYTKMDKYTYEEWHTRWGISPRMLKKMFLPMSLALKFLPPSELSAKVVLDVTGIFLRKNSASRMGFLNGSPNDKLTIPIANYVRNKGGEIRTNAKVSHLEMSADNQKIEAVVLENGEHLVADQFLTALPIHNLNKILPEKLYEQEFFANLKQIKGVPVISVQLWIDRQVSYIDNVLFSPDGPIPVYADMGNTNPEYQCEGKSRFHVCVAPAKDLMSKSDGEVINLVWESLRACFPESSRDAKVIKSTIVRIPNSVYYPGKNIDHLRPTQQTPISNLVLGGGYTQQRFYDSMEGAVQSGKLAAQVLIRANVTLPAS
jgi:15-cis-phytoene desaturase